MTPDGDRSQVLVYAAAAGIVTLVAYLFIVGYAILLPFVIAIFAAHLINAGVAATGRLTIGGRPLPRALRYSLSLAVLAVAAWLVVRLVIGNVSYVVGAAPTYEQNLVRLANQGGGWLGLEAVNDVRFLLERLNLSGLLRNLAFGLTGIIGSFGTVAIYTVFLLVEQRHFSAKLAALCRDPSREALVRRIFQQIGTEIQAYVWLKTLFSLATSAASYAVMKAIGLDLAEFWALLIFALNFIPYIGAWLGVIFPSFLSLVQFDTLTPFLVTTGALALIQFTGGSIIEPRVMGSGLNVSPVVMLLSLAFWGAIWGIVGMFLAVPILVVVLIVCSHFESTRAIAILLSATGDLRT